MGRASFRERMLALMGGECAQTQSSIDPNENAHEVSRHDSLEAERWVACGLAHFGLRRDELCELPKGDVRKLAIARVVRMRSVVTNRWLAETLKIGHVSRLRGRALEQIEVRKLAASLEKHVEFITWHDS